MTPRFDQLVNELKKTPTTGIDYAREKGAEFVKMPATGKAVHHTTGGKGLKFWQVTRDVDTSMLKLAQDEAKHLKDKAFAGKKNLDADKKELKVLKKPVKTQV